MFEYSLEVLKELNITTRILSDEEFSYKEKKTNYLIELCRNFEATTYISNKGSQDYVDLGLFKKNNINHFFINYKNYVYDNKINEFEENFTCDTVSDLIDNNSENSFEELDNSISNDDNNDKEYILRVDLNNETPVMKLVKNISNKITKTN